MCMKCVYDVVIKACFIAIQKLLQYFVNNIFYDNVSPTSQNNSIKNKNKNMS